MRVKKIARVSASCYFVESCDESLKRLVARPHPSVFVVWRRRPTWSFGWQIKTFGGGEIRGRPCVKRYFVPARGSTTPSGS